MRSWLAFFTVVTFASLSAASEPGAPLAAPVAPAAAEPEFDPKDYPRTFVRDGKTCRQEVTSEGVAETCWSTVDSLGKSNKPVEPAPPTASLPPEVAEALRLGAEAHGLGGGFKAAGFINLVSGAGLLIVAAASAGESGSMGVTPGLVTVGIGAVFTAIGYGYGSSGDDYFHDLSRTAPLQEP